MTAFMALAESHPALAYLAQGGPVLWLIAGLSVVTLALILAILARLVGRRVWASRLAVAAIAAWEQGDRAGARAAVIDRPGALARFASAAMGFRGDPALPVAAARERTEHLGRAMLADLRGGFRALEVIALVAPLLGLLGTVLGMIEAFQALQAAGGRADPAALAGGIWEALLTTAAGMAVAIPATLALSWFEGVVDRLQLLMEGAATRIFAAPPA
ncbi:MAG: MotA/TolQ/ExbB proton channel family protein [Rhodobacteraceae bacterium]|jgi:biopolymer transport protein ExbB|nr:MotA/TolQ/ExbB proton channel family protein [Paracoccaceae bacterium]MBL4558675.1 MotA/TolQ/ExbB proton channel family protein [Paracoccaceae bacterium]